MIGTEEAARLAGVTFRQASYWLQTGVVPHPRQQHDGRPGQGFHYEWSRSDIARLRIVAQVMALGGEGRYHSNAEAARLAMKYWRKGPGWLVLSPVDGTGVLSTTAEKVPKAVRRVGHRALVVPLP